MTGPPRPPPPPPLPLEEEPPLLFDHELVVVEVELDPQSSTGLLEELLVELFEPHESVPQGSAVVVVAAALGAGELELTPAHSSAAALLVVSTYNA